MILPHPRSTRKDTLLPYTTLFRSRLQALLGDQQRAFNETTVGKRVDVLLERPGRRMGQLVGKSPWLQSVHVEVAGAAIGDLVTVDIVSAGPNSLAGTLPAKAAA